MRFSIVSILSANKIEFQMFQFHFEIPIFVRFGRIQSIKNLL